MNIRKIMLMALLCLSAFFVACSNSAEQPSTAIQVEMTQIIEAESTEVVEAIGEEVETAEESPANEFFMTLEYTRQAPAMDPAKGYFVDEIADGIYWVSGSFYQAMFLTTGEGVIAVDAPQPMGASFLAAIQEVTDEPVTHVIYSHGHADHIGGAGLLPQAKEYIAHQNAAAQLSGVPAPTITFEDSYTLEVGNQVLELAFIGSAHSDGDIVVYAPRQKVAMYIDLLHPGSAPFAGFGASIDLDAYVRAHDTLLENYDFDVLIPGHTELLATKSHLETNKSFTLSMRNIVEEAMGVGNSAEMTQTCIDKSIAEWSNKLANVADRAQANCRAMIQFVQSQPSSNVEPTTSDGPTTFLLPERPGERVRTSGTVPHVQFDVAPVQEVNDELYRRAFSLPSVTNEATIVSLPGARGMWLGEGTALANPQAIVNGREFAHIHPDGSLHAPLPLERALEVHEKKWGERHPWAEERPGFEGFVLLYTPQSMEELDVIFQLIVESFNHVTGQSLQAADFQ